MISKGLSSGKFLVFSLFPDVLKRWFPCQKLILILLYSWIWLSWFLCICKFFVTEDFGHTSDKFQFQTFISNHTLKVFKPALFHKWQKFSASQSRVTWPHWHVMFCGHCPPRPCTKYVCCYFWPWESRHNNAVLKCLYVGSAVSGCYCYDLGCHSIIKINKIDYYKDSFLLDIHDNLYEIYHFTFNICVFFNWSKLAILRAIIGLEARNILLTDKLQRERNLLPATRVERTKVC